MARKLTIVVTCTNRKSVAPPAQHQVRNLSADGVDARATAWSQILSASSDRRHLRCLYQGEAWQQVARLEAAVHAKGIVPQLVVASAGLGLRRIDSEGPSYSATFSGGHPDTVGRGHGEIQAWWRHVSRTPDADPPEQVWRGPTLLVLSSAYTAAMSEDLRALGTRDDVVVFGGPPGLLGQQRFPSDLGMRARLGGTATSINLRMAAAWIERQETVNMRAEATRREWLQWTAAIGCPPAPSFRETIDDKGLHHWISAMLQSQPRLSKTAALRLLRDSGVACEQRRFGEVFTLARRTT